MKLRQKRILAIHDLSGFGNTSLMAVIPLMYKAGIAVTALPTAILSANTCYDSYQELDSTAFMQKCLDHWQKLDLHFDAIYSGFLGNPKQVEIVCNALELFAGTDTIVVVDPVLADDGELYCCYDLQMVSAMRILVGRADLITPNYTEACLLAEFAYKPNPKPADIAVICRKLADLGASTIVITSVPGADKTHSNVVLYDARTGHDNVFECEYIPCFYPGTGDVFTAILVAEMINGSDISQSIQCAIAFVKEAILQSQSYDHDTREGVVLEHALKAWRQG